MWWCVGVGSGSWGSWGNIEKNQTVAVLEEVFAPHVMGDASSGANESGFELYKPRILLCKEGNQIIGDERVEPGILLLLSA